ncbi:transcriptional regulator, TetR family [Lentibacillus halodurans]|uniref:Transcriptional regulator, TetR family n=1 Tax=Lentibacillus halodurans TaxID=237679 RepID=A0A1I0YIB6_9BACI|nr:TetR/AcrR family transcriptional regulator [Lentibacillus halodurans]SFB11903.1 transcriptional regulator, TetR family [Lentibacillus halodurans]
MKDLITQQAIVLFGKKGFSETSIQDIVDALDVTKGTFYYYFTSKEQLLKEIHHEYITDLLERQNGIIQSDALNQKEKITGIIRLLITDIADKGPSARVFFREMRHLTNENAEVIKQKREDFRLNIEKILRTGIKQGEFQQDLRTDMTAFGILGVTNWSYNWFNPHGEVSPEELAKLFSDMILTGIVPDER